MVPFQFRENDLNWNEIYLSSFFLQYLGAFLFYSSMCLCHDIITLWLLILHASSWTSFCPINHYRYLLKTLAGLWNHIWRSLSETYNPRMYFDYILGPWPLCAKRMDLIYLVYCKQCALVGLYNMPRGNHFIK
jgi:hypothetical protein